MSIGSTPAPSLQFARRRSHRRQVGRVPAKPAILGDGSAAHHDQSQLSAPHTAGAPVRACASCVSGTGVAALDMGGEYIPMRTS
jgi:hypothetical protein